MNEVFVWTFESYLTAVALVAAGMVFSIWVVVEAAKELIRRFSKPRSNPEYYKPCKPGEETIQVTTTHKGSQVLAVTTEGPKTLKDGKWVKS